MPRPSDASSTPFRPTAAQRRVLETLKRDGPSVVRAVARRLRTTEVAVRQHLAVLREQGLVAATTQPPSGRGRPSVRWSLTDRAVAHFPDRHAELTVGLIDAIRKTLGEPALHRIVEVRARDQLNLYRELAPPSASLRKKVEALAARRTAEGYMAEVVERRRGEYLLVEHHCPICEAATACTGLCAAELRVFRETLGDDVEVERTTHLLADGDRCVYRIRRRRGTPATRPDRRRREAASDQA